MKIKKLLQQHKKHITLGLIVGFIFAAGVFSPNITNAMFGITLSSIVTFIFKAIAYIFNFIAGIFFAIATSFVSFTLSLNMDVADPSMNTIAYVGWKICRDIANLGFVLLTVVMAFMTIIRVQNYGAKKVLLSLIIAAVVVNFSFTIAGVIIDFSNVLTHFFIGRIGGGTLGTGFTSTLANAFGPQKFLLEAEDDPIPPDPSQEESGLVSFGVAILSSIAALFFIVFFTLLSTIVMIIMAGMFLVRYVVLTFLLILAPMAWLFWVFPGLKSYNNMWWSYFWKYVFFAPAASFFVYLSLVAADNLKGEAYQSKISAAVGGGLPGALGKVAQQGTQMIVVAGLMIGAITVAQKMGIFGASIANKAKDGLISGAKTYGKNRANAIGTKLSQSKAGAFVSSKLGLAGKKLKGTGEDIEKQREAKRKEKANIQKQYEERKITQGEMERRLKEANKGNVGLWLKEKTLAGRFKKAGGTLEKGGEKIDAQALKKIEEGGFMTTSAKGALAEGLGLFKKKEKKEGPKSLAEKEKDLRKVISEKQKFIDSGRFKEGDKALAELDKQIEIQTGGVVTARGNKYKSMTTEDLEKEHSKILENEKKGGNNAEKELNRRTRESLEKTLSGKIGGKMTTVGQVEDAIKEAKTAADKDTVEGLDPTFHQEMVRSLEKQKERLEGKLGATAKAFDVIEKKIDKLNTERSEKLKEIKQNNPSLSMEEISNHEDIKEIDERIKDQKNQISGWKEVLSQGKYNEETIGKRVKALNEIQTELGDDDTIKEIRQELEKKREKMNADLEEIREKRKKK